MDLKVFVDSCTRLRDEFGLDKLPDSLLNEVWNIIKNKDDSHIKLIVTDLMRKNQDHIFSKFDFTGELLPKAKGIQKVLKDLKAKSLYDAMLQKKKVINE